MTAYFVDINGELNRPPSNETTVTGVWRVTSGTASGVLIRSKAAAGALSGAVGTLYASTLRRFISLGGSVRLFAGSVSSSVYRSVLSRSISGSISNLTGAVTKFSKRSLPALSGSFASSTGALGRKLVRPRNPSASPALFTGTVAGTKTKGLAFADAIMGILSGSLGRVFKRSLSLAGSFTSSGVVSYYKLAAAQYYRSTLGSLTMSGVCAFFRRNPKVTGTMGAFVGTVEIYRGALYYGTVPE